MRLFHRTDHAEVILRDGFRDGEGGYLATEGMYRGVWLSDRPLDVHEGAEGEFVIAVEVPEGVVADFEWIEEGKPYREWLIPASVVNRYARQLVSDDDPLCSGGGSAPESPPSSRPGR